MTVLKQGEVLDDREFEPRGVRPSLSKHTPGAPAMRLLLVIGERDGPGR